VVRPESAVLSDSAKAHLTATVTTAVFFSVTDTHLNVDLSDGTALYPGPPERGQPEPRLPPARRWADPCGRRAFRSFGSKHGKRSPTKTARTARWKWLLADTALIVLVLAASGPLMIVCCYSFLSPGKYGRVAWKFSTDAWFRVSCAAIFFRPAKM